MVIYRPCGHHVQDVQIEDSDDFQLGDCTGERVEYAASSVRKTSGTAGYTGCPTCENAAKEEDEEQVEEDAAEEDDEEEEAEGEEIEND